MKKKAKNIYFEARMEKGDGAYLFVHFFFFALPIQNFLRHHYFSCVIDYSYCFFYTFLFQLYFVMRCEMSHSKTPTPSTKSSEHFFKIYAEIRTKITELLDI